MAARLLVSDLDGTLIDGTGVLAPELVAAVARAIERGLAVSLATGRMPPGAARYRDELGLTAPLVYYNGALVRDHEGGRDLLSLTLPRGLLWEAYEIFAQAPVHPLFYRDDELYCLERSMPVRGYADEQGLRVHEIPDPPSFLRQGSFVKSLLIGHPAILPVVREELGALTGEAARLVMTRADYLELIPTQASKGAALRVVAEHLGVPLAETIAVGDQENDLEMLEAAGVGIAMPHAPDSVRAAADLVPSRPGVGGLLALLAELAPEHFG
jgi:hypothetical protein